MEVCVLNCWDTTSHETGQAYFYLIIWLLQCMKIFCSCLGKFNFELQKLPSSCICSIHCRGWHRVCYCVSQQHGTNKQKKSQPHLQLSEATREQIAGGLLGMEFQILPNHLEHQLLPTFLFHKQVFPMVKLKHALKPNVSIQEGGVEVYCWPGSFHLTNGFLCLAGHHAAMCPEFRCTVSMRTWSEMPIVLYTLSILVVRVTSSSIYPLESFIML